MKKINPVLAVCGVLVILFSMVLLYRAMMAERSFKMFETTAKIRSGDIIYDSVKRPLFGNGFILYKVRIPALNVPHTIEKAVIRPIPENGVNVRLYDVRIPVIDALRQVYGEGIVSVMKNYQPYRDVLRHPLITLGVMDVDVARFDLSLSLKPSLTNQTIQGKVRLRDLCLIDFSGVVKPLSEGTKNPVFALYGHLTQLAVQMQEWGGFNRYRAYAETSGVPVPVGMPKLAVKEKTETLVFTFDPPVSTMPVYKIKPH